MGRVKPHVAKQPESAWERGLDWVGQQRPMTWFLVNVGNRIDPVLMKLSGGRLKSSLSAPTVLLTHTGAKSGKVRRTPLAYITDGDDVVLIASKGGAEHNPAWYHNVRANPEIELWTGGGGGRYRAREAEGDERDRLWRQAATFYSGFDDYQRRADAREIPVIVCSPLES